MIDDLDVLSDLDQLRSRYEILGELGHDGGAVVYHGRSLRSSCEVAIKVMRTRQPLSAKPGARLVWQAHTVMQLHHPNLVELQAVHHLQGGTVALAIEHRRWRTLAEVIRSVGPLPLAQVELVLRDVAGVLAYLHSCGVIHRGVRPQNILLDEERGRALLADFGIDTTENDPGDPAVREVMVRTLASLAPEQIDGRTASAQSDLYSLGLVGYAMLTGGQPWEGVGLTDPLPSLATLRPEAPVQLCRAIEGALDKKSSRRWRSAEEFLAQLDPSTESTRAAPTIDYAGLLAGVRGSAEALGRALAEHGLVERRGKLVLAASSVVAGVAALSLLERGPQPSSHSMVENPVPAVTAAPSPAPMELTRADDPPPPAEAALASVPAPSRGSIAQGLPRRTRVPAPRAPRLAAAAPAPERPYSARPLRSYPRLLGDLVVSSRGAALLGTPVQSGPPPLLGDPVRPDRVGDVSMFRNPI